MLMIINPVTISVLITEDPHCWVFAVPARTTTNECEENAGPGVATLLNCATELVIVKDD